MTNEITENIILFETTDVFGIKVRTTKSYWEKITKEKHQELKAGLTEVRQAIENPTYVYRSVQDNFIKLFYKIINNKKLVVVTKYIDDYGFIVTCYETEIDRKPKGEKLWPN